MWKRFFSGHDSKMTHASDDWETTRLSAAFRIARAFGVLDIGECGGVDGDWFGDYSKTAATNPLGVQVGLRRAFRGGSWLDHDAASFVPRAAPRGIRRSVTTPSLGFRCARGIESSLIGSCL